MIAGRHILGYEVLGSSRDMNDPKGADLLSVRTGHLSSRGKELSRVGG